MLYLTWKNDPGSPCWQRTLSNDMLVRLTMPAQLCNRSNNGILRLASAYYEGRLRPSRTTKELHTAPAKEVQPHESCS